VQKAEADDKVTCWVEQIVRYHSHSTP